jgi:2-polyprenyl-3-methyl-5-hydroxy-6-metoxy-1,4-benzoquinol methylase
MKTRAKLKEFMRAGYRLIRGGGEPGLLRKQAYHAQRRIAERRILEDAGNCAAHFTPNRCPACGGNGVSGRFTNPVGFSFAVCESDGTVYMDPVLSPEALCELYNDQSYTSYWSSLHIAGTDDVCRIRRFSGNGPRKRLLDIGCATGELLKRVEDCFVCSGVEINSGTAEIARQAGFDVTTGTLDDVAGEERFDVITMLQLIEHITEPRAMLERAFKLLKPGGLLYLDTPCIDSASFALFRSRHVHVSSFGHVSLFTKQSLTHLADRCGYKILEHSYCGGTDLQLYDLIGRKFAPARYNHRTAFYSPRFINGCYLLDMATLGILKKLFLPPGNESYQWTTLQRPLAADATPQKR